MSKRPESTSLTRAVSRSTRIRKTRITGVGLPWKTVSPIADSNLPAFCIVDKVAQDPNCGLFAIFDGHGGRQVSDHCADRFPIEIRKEMQKGPSDVCTVLTTVFAKIDNELRLVDSDGCGSTACVTVVRKEGAHLVLYVANIGDTRCVLSKSGIAERLSIDDRCDNPDEVTRIKA